MADTTTTDMLIAENAALRAELEGRVVELERSQRLLHHVLDSSPSAIFIKDLEGRFLLVNRRAAAIMGRTPDDLIGRADHELFDAKYVQYWRSAEQAVVSSGQPLEQEEQAPQPEGLRTFHTSRAPIRDETGAIYAIAGISTDITERARTEEALRESQHRLQTIIDSLPHAIYWKDRNSVYQGCNQPFAFFSGLASPAAIVGLTDADMPWAGADAEQYRAQDRAVIETDTPELHVIQTHQQPGGKKVWVDTNKIPLRDKDGVTVGVLGTYEDITEDKENEQALQSSQAMLRSLFDHLPVAVFMKAAEDGRFVLWNSSCERLFGFPADQIVGRTDHDLFPKEQADSFRAKDREVLASRTTMLIPEEQVDSSTLGTRTVRTTKVPILDSEGNPTHLLVICYDLTDLRQSDEQRTLLQAQVIEAQQHALRELSTPLLPLSNKVVLMPIIGAMDSRRAQQVIETLLDGVAQNNAEIAIVDITGVQVVDTQVANAFIQSARAVQLLGARVMLTGIRPEVAQTLVQLGVDLQGMLTRGSLQAGIAYAFNR